LAKGKKAATGQCSSCGKILSDANIKANTTLCDDCAGRNITSLTPAAKTAAPASPKAVPKAAPAKAGKSPADPLRGGPDPAKMPKGFDDWAIDLARSKDGLMRVDLRKKYGHEVKWFGYLKQIAAAKGLTATMERVGRLTLFRMKGGTAKAEAAPAMKPTPAIAAKSVPAAAAKVSTKNDVTPNFRKGASAKKATKH
jgi:hypothetical protein